MQSGLYDNLFVYIRQNQKGLILNCLHGLSFLCFRSFFFQKRSEVGNYYH